MAVRELHIEALGDDFAFLSGEWFEGSRVAQHVEKASRVWAFCVDSLDAVAALMETLSPGTSERIIGISPGVQPGWDTQGRAGIFRLLSLAPDEKSAVGLLLAVPQGTCACPHKAENRNACGGCGGTNGCPQALNGCNTRYTIDIN